MAPNIIIKISHFGDEHSPGFPRAKMMNKDNMSGIVTK